MRFRLALTTMVGLTFAPQATLRGQGSGDFAAYFALNFTPIGAFAPQPVAPPSLRGRSAFAFRYGRLEAGQTDFNHLGFGWQRPAGEGDMMLTIGTSFCSGCDGNLMVGFDWHLPIARQTLTVGLHPALGLGRTFEDDGATTVAGALTLPVSYLLASGQGPEVVPFIDPGIGFGWVSAGGESEAGVRPVIGGGVMFANLGGAALLVGFQKVIIDGGETVIGIGLTIGGARR